MKCKLKKQTITDTYSSGVTNEAGLEKKVLVNTVTVFNMIDEGALIQIK